MSKPAKEARQLYLFEDTELVTELDARLWHGSFNSRESTLQQLSPHVGKMKSGMARTLINLYSEPGDTVLAPFSGSGVVPLEAALAGRRAWANDLSPYAYVLTRGKLETPGSRKVAIERAKALIDIVEQDAPNVNLTTIPEWVRDFFHPNTLREVFTAFRICVKRNTRLMNSMKCMLIVICAPGC